MVLLRYKMLIFNTFPIHSCLCLKPVIQRFHGFVWVRGVPGNSNRRTKPACEAIPTQTLPQLLYETQHRKIWMVSSLTLQGSLMVKSDGWVGLQIYDFQLVSFRNRMSISVLAWHSQDCGFKICHNTLSEPRVLWKDLWKKYTPVYLAVKENLAIEQIVLVWSSMACNGMYLLNAGLRS